MSGLATSRPLSEISPMGIRRNSPSFIQTTKKPSVASGDSSPFDTSPTSNAKLAFWKNRENASPTRPDSEKPSSVQVIPSPPARRASVENLKKVSRVTNSTMYAREQDSEYDPDASSIISNRPFNAYSGNAWGASIDIRSNPSVRGHKRTESNTAIPILSPNKLSSPTKQQFSPQKSSLSSSSRFGEQGTFALDEATVAEDTVIVSNSRAGTPRSLRHPKSVTFDAQPPQVNEYEMVTPDPSSVASESREGSYESDQYDMDESFEHGSFAREDSFDESLEDADKTPVVLPEDWRFMSPAVANTGLAETFDDPFEKRQSIASPALHYRGTPDRDVRVTRANSVNSDGDRRPLPPLPGGQVQERQTSSASTGALPKPHPSIVSPPRPASMSKAEILGMRASPMPLAERLQLLSVQTEEAEKKAEEARKAEEAKKQTSMSLVEKLIKESKQAPEAEEYKPPPRVSRESILRHIRSEDFDDEGYGHSSPMGPQSFRDDEIDYANLDPDVPIPSRETSSSYDDEIAEKAIKREEDVENTIDMYAIPESNGHRAVSPYDDEYLRESSVLHHRLPDDEVSEVSSEEHASAGNSEDADGVTTPRPHDSPASVPAPALSSETVPESLAEDGNRMSLPMFTSFFEKDDFGFGLSSYLTPPPPQLEAKRDVASASTNQVIEQKPDLRPLTPVEQLQAPPTLRGDSFEEIFGTPDSVIHYPLPDVAPIAEQPTEDSLGVPEPVATIKASGSKLKTRVSATPADLYQMVAARRHVSGEQPPRVDEPDNEDESTRNESLSQTLAPKAASPPLPTQTFNRRQSIRKLDVPLAGFSDELGLGLTEEFDRLLEAKKVRYPHFPFPRLEQQLIDDFMPGLVFWYHKYTTDILLRAQKGYKMRENTKVVVANSRCTSTESKASETIDDRPTSAMSGELRPDSARGTRSAGNSPRKPSAQTWTTEPWNGRMRRQSTRRTNIVPEKPMALGPVPPLPGQESNVLDVVAEDSFVDDTDENEERGRLFVKVLGVKDLDLPLPKKERCHFQMTLDNGLHCVTTSWAELGRTAPIGQEFELVVFDDLEFQLLLQTRIERPKSSASSVQSSTASITTKKTSAFSRMFTSPKKRREQEKKQQEDEARMTAQRQAEMEAQKASREPTAWDLQNELVGPDGSFARAYISLSNHEQQCYGRPFTVDIPAWNEWSVEDKTGASTRSKLGGVQRKPPYRIGNVELQLMYIPRPRGITDDEMPRSMSAAIRQLKEAEATVTLSHEGHLSQQGGDCPYWRRRFFKLNGSKLTAYHDMTRQPRATIALGKAAKLIDDKSSLTKTEQGSPTKGKGRRKSAFAEDEEGYMYLEEGFRIRFHNGEVIDFYADTREHKEEWMKVLSQAVGRESPVEKKTWMSVVLAKEIAARASKPTKESKLHQVKEEQIPVRDTSKTGPASVHKQDVFSRLSTTSGVKENKPAPIEKSPGYEATQQSPKKSRTSTSSPVKTQAGFKVPAKPDTSPSKRHSAATGSTSSAASPSKRHSAATGSTSSATSPSKRHSAASGSAASAASPGKQDKAAPGRRAAVRSMIF